MLSPNCPLDLKHTVLHYPTDHILLVVLNRPEARNCMTKAAQYEMEKIMLWFDKNPNLLCAVITGAGCAFSAGGDLIEWDRLNDEHMGTHDLVPRWGSGGLTRRFGKKTVIAAVNGPAVGGGFEMLMGVDLIIASSNAKFGLPEVKVGVVAMAGCLPRLMKNVGRQRAMQLALTGDSITADQAFQWGIVNEVVPDGHGIDNVLERPVVLKALEYAAKILKNSPDSVILSRAGVLMGHEHGSAETAAWLICNYFDQGFDESENLKEGVKAFAQKRRKPAWKL